MRSFLRLHFKRCLNLQHTTMLILSTTTQKAVLTQVSPDTKVVCKRSTGKVTVVGAGTVGTAIAYTLLAQNVSNDVVLIDKNDALAKGEMLDIMHATMFLDSPTISYSSDYAETAGSKIVVIAAGSRNYEDKKDAATKQNMEIFREIIGPIVSINPNCILIVCSYPVDEMAYVAWKFSGLPPHRIIGIGNMLENARFRTLIAQKLNVSPADCQAFIIGEQGLKSIPVWNSVSVAGIKLRDVNPNLGRPQDPEDWQSLFVEVIESNDEVCCLKECPSWGIALCVSKLAKAVLDDTGECFTVSTHIKGCRHGIDKDVFLSLPCIVGCTGIRYFIKQYLSDDEKSKLQTSADRIYELLKNMNLVYIGDNEEFKCP